MRFSHNFIFCNYFQMHCLHRLRNMSVYNIVQRQLINCTEQKRYEVSSGKIFRMLCVTTCTRERESVAKPLRSTKRKSKHDNQQYFVDIKQVR